MSNKTKLIIVAALAACGAVIGWIASVTGLFTWQATSEYGQVARNVLNVVLGTYFGYVFTRGQPVVVRLDRGLTAIFGLIALSWLSDVLGFTHWLAYCPSWHAALLSSVLVGLAGAAYFYWQARKSQS